MPGAAVRVHTQAEADAALFEAALRLRAPVGVVAIGAWRDWLAAQFPEYVTYPFADHQANFWDWLDAITPGVRPRPRLEAWPRGSGKSTTSELGVTRVGVKLARRFALYLCGTQDQADKHVESIGVHFERLGYGRAVNRYGQSRGWRHNELRTATGFNVVALGLDKASRGIKIDQYRPDLIAIDDVDEYGESESVRLKKIAAITSKILPLGSPDVAIWWTQNLIDRDSLMNRLVTGKVDFLRDRQLGAVVPAAYDLTVEELVVDGDPYYHVTGGRATWAGQDLDRIEYQYNTWGPTAFLREAQHDFTAVDGGLWQEQRDIERWRVRRAPSLVRVGVAVDPSATSGGDEAGIIGGGVDSDGVGYVLADKTIQGSPNTWAEAAVSLYEQLEADVLIAEANNGGEMVEGTIKSVPGAPPVKLVHASRGKLVRAEPVHALSERGRIRFVGRFPQLELELRSWRPGKPSPNRLDAFVWLWTELLVNAPAEADLVAPQGFAGAPRWERPAGR